jgi:5-methylcytosine-specific restriction endonuclease McrA
MYIQFDSKEMAIKYLLEQLKWSKIQVDVGVRANFFCEYCGKDLLASVDYYDQFQIDHIVPNDDNNIDNLALSCRLCNFMKRNTDPSDKIKDKTRENLLSNAKKIINERRTLKTEQFIKTLLAIHTIRNT